MKIAKHSYELVHIAEATGVSSYTMPVVRVIEPYILSVKGAKAVYEINADARIAPVSTISHVQIDNDGAELDGNPDTCAWRKTNSNTTEDVKTYDFQVVKPLFVCVTYYCEYTSIQIHASEDGTTWTLAFESGDSVLSKTTGCFFVKARYLKWVIKNADTNARFTHLYELEAYDCSQTTIVSYPDEFDCIIHEAQRKTAANGSRWYTLLIEPYEDLAFDYWLYKLRPTMGYYKVTLDKEPQSI